MGERYSIGVWRGREKRRNVMQYRELSQRFEASQRFETAEMWGAHQFDEISAELRKFEMLASTIAEGRKKIENFLSAIRGLRTSWELAEFDTSTPLWFFLGSKTELLCPHATDFNEAIMQIQKTDVRWISDTLKVEYRELVTHDHAIFGPQVFVSVDNVQQVQCKQCSMPAFLVGRYGVHMRSDAKQEWELTFFSLCLSCMNLERLALRTSSSSFI